jgi:hypothetical protein
MTGTHSSSHSQPPGIGTKVEVRTRFDGSWSRGFEIAEVEDDGYRVKRMTDGAVLPSVFGDHEVRRERRTTSWNEGRPGAGS